MIKGTLTANETRSKKVTNTWDISTNKIKQNRINKQNQTESHMKNELEKEKKKKQFKAPLNTGPLNLPEDNTNSSAELRMNALTFELGSP